MNRIVILVVIILMSNSVLGQQNEPSSKFTKAKYLRKSRHQQKAAMAFGLPGAGLFILGGYVFSYGLTEETLQCNERKNAILLSLGLVFTGSVLVIIADRFERASVRNKNKAVSLGLRNQFIPQIQGAGLVYHAIPSIVLKMHL